MINIGEISKPSVSESRVSPARSSENAERVTAIESLDATSKVSSQLEQKNKKRKTKHLKGEDKDSLTKKTLVDAETQQTPAIEEGDDIYDEKGGQFHHASLDVKA